MVRETIYFVDENDIPTGEISEKISAHHEKTKLHAAFSCYLFNQNGQLLVSRRAHSKLVWPSVWTNSCCGHPAPGESREEAIERRLDYELGLQAKNIVLIVPDYIYTTPLYNGIIENEFCPLYTAITTADPRPNPDEVMEYRWIEWDLFINQLEQDLYDYHNISLTNPPIWSWWCKDQIRHLKLKDLSQIIRH